MCVHHMCVCVDIGGMIGAEGALETVAMMTDATDTTTDAIGKCVMCIPLFCVYTRTNACLLQSSVTFS